MKRRSTAHAGAWVLALSLAVSLLPPTQGSAQTPPPAGPPPAAAPAPTVVPPYGAAITLDVAKQVMAGAEAEAEKNKWPVAIVILDSGGNIVMLHRRDDTQLAATTTAEGKARTALYFKRPTKLLDEVISGGGSGLRYLALKDFVPLEGGIPILVEGKIVGAIGVSGVLSAQDTQVARAGIDALAK
jgi:glc operon protein GlcG